MSSLSAVLNAVVSEQLAELRTQPYDRLILLPDHRGTKVVRDNMKLEIYVWHDVLDSGEHRIVVQVGKPGILGSWRLDANGFAINSRNERRDLTEDELSSFL